MVGLKVMGIDPGSRFTGYGIIADHNRTQDCIAHGRIIVKGKTTADRLFHIYTEIQQLIALHQPDELAIEQVFFHRNAKSALKLGEARSAAMIAAASLAVIVNEYSPKAIKQAVVGYGNADKTQVQRMVCTLLKLKETPEFDATDALATAICHCQTRQLTRKIGHHKEKETT